MAMPNRLLDWSLATAIAHCQIHTFVTLSVLSNYGHLWPIHGWRRRQSSIREARRWMGVVSRRSGRCCWEMETTAKTCRETGGMKTYRFGRFRGQRKRHKKPPMAGFMICHGAAGQSWQITAIGDTVETSGHPTKLDGLDFWAHARPAGMLVIVPSRTGLPLRRQGRLGM